MSDCCASSHGDPAPTGKLPCPGCGQVGSAVTTRTIFHHVTTAWAWRPRAQRHFFCASPACDVVYFGDDGSTLGTAQVRTRVGLKDAGADALVCFCFGVRRGDLQAHPGIRQFVIDQTRAGVCACDTRHPAGRCCLKDFPVVPPADD